MATIERANTTDPLKRTLFQLSFPLFLQSLVMFAVMVIDMMIWSAHGPNTAAALSVAGQVLRVAVELSAVMGIGGVILISQHLGRGDHEMARLTAEVACMANVILGGGLSLIVIFGGPLILRLMALQPDLEVDSTLYLHLTGAAMLFLCFGNTAVACLRGYGHSKLVMILGLFGAVIYLALEFLLVLGPGPFPAFGVGGAGAANLATRAIFAVVLTVAVLRVLGLRLRVSRILEHFRMIRRMLSLALPSVSDFIAYGFYQIVLLGVIAAEGEVAVLARAYVMIAMAFFTLVIMAIVQGTEVMIGYRLGAGRYVEARRQGFRSALIASVVSMACAAIVFFQAEGFIGLFTDDPAVVDLSKKLLFLTIFLQPCFAVNMVLFHALRAIEDVQWPVLVSQCLSWAGGLPLAWALCAPLGFGIVGVWIAFFIEELAKALAMSWRWTRKGTEHRTQEFHERQ